MGILKRSIHISQHRGGHPTKHIEDGRYSPPARIIESLKAVKHIDAAHLSVPHKSRVVELLAGKESAIAQVARTIIGKTCALTFLLGDVSNSCEGSMVVEAYAGIEVKIRCTSPGKGGYKPAVLHFVATTTRTHIVFF